MCFPVLSDQLVSSGDEQTPSVLLALSAPLGTAPFIMPASWRVPCPGPAAAPTLPRHPRGSRNIFLCPPSKLAKSKVQLLASARSSGSPRATSAETGRSGCVRASEAGAGLSSLTRNSASCTK